MAGSGVVDRTEVAESPTDAAQALIEEARRAQRLRRRRRALTLSLVLGLALLVFFLGGWGAGWPPFASSSIQGNGHNQAATDSTATARTQVRQVSSFGAAPDLSGVSCPSSRTCWMVGSVMASAGLRLDYAALFESTNGGLSWTRRTMPAISDSSAGGISLACPSATHCVGASTQYSGVNGHGVTRLALAVTSDAARSWHVFTTPAPNLSATVMLSCPTTTHCMVLAGGANEPSVALISTDGGLRWRPASFPTGNPSVRGLSCASVNRCVAVGTTGSSYAAVSQDFGSSWQLASVPNTGWVTSVQCQTTLRCYALSGAVLTSVDGGSTWSEAPNTQTLAKDLGLKSTKPVLSCVSATSCLIVSERSPSRTNPLGGIASFRTADSFVTVHEADQVLGDAALPVALTCASGGSCVAVSGQGTVIRSSNEGGTWRNESAGVIGLYVYPATLTCSSSTTCRIAGSATQSEGSAGILATDNGGASWQRFVDPGLGGIHSLSCPTATVCVALTDPPLTKLLPYVPQLYAGRSVDGGKTFSAPVPLPGSYSSTGAAPLFPGLSCPTPQTCWAVFDAFSGVAEIPGPLQVDESTDGGSSWHAVTNVPSSTSNDAIPTIQCPSAQWCLLRESEGGPRTPAVVEVTRDGGVTWRASAFPQSSLNALSCTSDGTCLGIGYNQRNTFVARSNNYGASWTISSTRVRGEQLVCAGGGRCVLAGVNSFYVTTDLGRNWSLRTPPPGIGEITSPFMMSCPPGPTCWVSGTTTYGTVVVLKLPLPNGKSSR